MRWWHTITRCEVVRMALQPNYGWEGAATTAPVLYSLCTPLLLRWRTFLMFARSTSTRTSAESHDKMLRYRRGSLRIRRLYRGSTSEAHLSLKTLYSHRQVMLVCWQSNLHLLRSKVLCFSHELNCSVLRSSSTRTPRVLVRVH